MNLNNLYFKPFKFLKASSQSCGYICGQMLYEAARFLKLSPYLLIKLGIIQRLRHIV